MKNRIVKLSIVAIAATFIGCGSDSSSSGDDFDSKLDSIKNSPKSNLSQPLKDSIAYMGNEERLAYDIYVNLYNYHGGASEVEKLNRIATKSEVKHIEIVQTLVKKYGLSASEVTNVESDLIDNPADASVGSMPSGKYDIPAIQSLYDDLYAEGTISKKAALETACKVEVVDINDLNNYLSIANSDGASDVVEAFEILRKGSYNHYWAFDSGLKSMGVSDGCCSLGSDYCHPEYPQNEKGGKGKGRS